MEELITNKHPNNFDDEISLEEIVGILWQGKWIITFITSLISIIAVVYSLLLPNIYESKALLVPVNSVGMTPGVMQSYSTIAGLAGINIPNNSDDNNAAKAMKKITSLSFFEDYILTNISLPNLMAVKFWDFETNTLVYDEDTYETNSKTWVRDYKYPMKQIPSAQESFEVFIKEHISLSEDRDTGFVSLSIKHQSPFIAKQWSELVIDEVNNFYRTKDRLESEKAVRYLNRQITTTGLSEIKQVIAQLLQEETKKLTLIEANKYYVFDYIDPPAVMELKSEPNRALICIIIALFGGLLSVVIVLLNHYFLKEKAA